MPIKISAKLKAKLPKDQKANIDSVLWDRSGGRCHLCEVPFNRASDDIEADHDTPEAEGGETSIDNLNLAHKSCNRAKRNAKTIPIRPYLKLVAHTKAHGGRLKYDGYLDHFEIQPRESYFTESDNEVAFEFPDGSKATAPVFTEKNNAMEFRFAYLQVPRNAIFNDDDCQPRSVKTDHVWDIYSDLQKNVLHEAPACRIKRLDGGKARLLMFDGQHKTIASWMMNRSSVIMKVYLNIDLPQANQLVNSIQAKIKKLPLSPFELAEKMSDEWKNKFQVYEDLVGSNAISEKGFIDWLGQEDRARGKQALQSALVQSVIGHADLRITRHIAKTGAPPKGIVITEQTLKSKIIEKLLHKDPLTEKGEDAQNTRDRETNNIVLCLNILNDLAFEPSPEAEEMTEIQKLRARRMSYQGALAYEAELIKQLWDRVLIRGGNKKHPISEKIDAEQEESLRAGIKILTEHPAWVTPFEKNPQMRELEHALNKNQEITKAFENLGLDLSYLVSREKSVLYRKAWMADNT